ncbi:MAG: D-mannonate dehydratase [Verrucomicrobiaceae bacterium]|nr:D-mannonate dehydratase [Verrucomicrobiaceae bacterium]
MKLGLGLKQYWWTDAPNSAYAEGGLLENPGQKMWTDEHLRLARQFGCESIIAWVPLPAGNGVWSKEDLYSLKKQVNKYGMELAGIENFHPAHWDHIVLGEEGRDEQMENICQTIKNAGEVGIECFGYSFSACGVQGYYTERGNSDGRGMSSIKRFSTEYIDDSPSPNQRFWFRTQIARRSPEGVIPSADEETVWDRFRYFLENALPVAEKANVKLCAHPDDPPIPYLKGIYRPLHSVEGLRKLIKMFDSPSNCIEFCQGTISTMQGVDIYSVIEEFASQDKIGYVHFRNTKGQFPEFSEVFIDDGDVDMAKAIECYAKYGFKGTLIPDHTPLIASPDPWWTGMGFALGYMRGIMQAKVGVR